MANKPTIYGFDDAGCKWGTIHKDDMYELLNEISKGAIPNYWDRVETNRNSVSISNICYGNGKYVAVGGGKISYSSDGITWNSSSEPNYLRDVCFGNGKFIAVGYNNSPKLLYSTDGINWTEVTNTTISGDGITACCFANGKFFIGGNKQIAYSTDGIGWTKITQSVFTSNIQTICYGNGRVIAGDDAGNIGYSDNGGTWAKISQSFITANMYRICYGNGNFVMGSNNGILYYLPYNSTELRKAVINVSTEKSVRVLCYGHGIFLASGYYSDGMNHFLEYSKDGLFWAEIPPIQKIGSMRAGCYVNGRFLIGGENGVSYISQKMEFTV